MNKVGKRKQVGTITTIGKLANGSAFIDASDEQELDANKDVWIKTSLSPKTDKNAYICIRLLDGLEESAWAEDEVIKVDLFVEWDYNKDEQENKNQKE